MELAKPCPVSPKPWRKIIVAVCLPEGATTTGSGILLRTLAALCCPDSLADFELLPPIQ